MDDLNKLINEIDEIKEKITDNEYLKLMDCCMKINKNTEKNILYYINRAPRIIEYIDEDDMTYQMALTAVKLNGLLLEDIHPDLHTIELVKIAIANAPASIEFVRTDLVTDELYFYALSFDRSLIRDMPKHIKILYVRGEIKEFQEKNNYIIYST